MHVDLHQTISHYLPLTAGGLRKSSVCSGSRKPNVPTDSVDPFSLSISLTYIKYPETRLKFSFTFESLWLKTPMLAFGIQVVQIPDCGLWYISVYQIPQLPALSVHDKSMCWWKNLVTKGEWGQLKRRRRRTPQDISTDIWHLPKHPPYLICRPETGKAFDIGMWAKRRAMSVSQRAMCWGRNN